MFFSVHICGAPVECSWKALDVLALRPVGSSRVHTFSHFFDPCQVVTWGDPSGGGDSRAVQEDCRVVVFWIGFRCCRDCMG